MEIEEEHIKNLTDSLRDYALLEDSLSNMGDGSMEIDNACLEQLIDILQLDESEEKVGKPKQKQLKKRRNRQVHKLEDIRVVRKALNGNEETKLKILVLTIDAAETSPWLLQVLHHDTTHI